MHFGDYDKVMNDILMNMHLEITDINHSHFWDETKDI